MLARGRGLRATRNPGASTSSASSSRLRPPYPCCSTARAPGRLRGVGDSRAVALNALDYPPGTADRLDGRALLRRALRESGANRRAPHRSRSCSSSTSLTSRLPASGATRHRSYPLCSARSSGEEPGCSAIGSGFGASASPTLEERARQAERETDRERRLAAAEERTRIARDLHDSAGHAINVILVHAGAARLLAEKDPAARARRSPRSRALPARPWARSTGSCARSARTRTRRRAADRPRRARRAREAPSRCRARRRA